MIVGGPNTRSDYHTNPTEEWFYQIKGSMVLRVIDQGHPKDIHIGEGQHFLLPPNTPHSPQRFADTIGLVVECDRPDGQHDALSYYCPQCGATNLSERFICTNLVTQLPPIINRYYADEGLRTCTGCGHVDVKPTTPVDIPDSLDTSAGTIGTSLPGPQPIDKWITQPNAVLSGIALRVEVFSPSSKDIGRAQSHAGEAWVYAIDDECTIDLGDDNHPPSGADDASAKTITLNKADCVVIKPRQAFTLNPKSHVIVVSHLIQEQS